MKSLTTFLQTVAESEPVKRSARMGRKAYEALNLPRIWPHVRAWRPNAAIALGVLGAFLTLFTFRMASVNANWQTALSALGNPALFLVNWLPIALWMLMWYYALGRPFAAFALTAAPVLLLTLINYYKLRLRGDPLMYADLSLAGEASAMGRRYNMEITPGIIMAVIVCVAVGIALWRLYRKREKPGVVCRLVGGSVCAAVLLCVGHLLVFSDMLYSRTALAVSWLPTQSYIEHGVLYPFLRSVKECMEKKPDGYSEARASATLAAYADSDIPEGRKVDVIGVMLEAFNDFSTFDNLDFTADPYADFHALEAESVHGRLVTNIFAGETVNTERAFLTGFLDPTENFRAPVNSFVWYLRQQGYACFGSHPGYNWFYNRLNVNEYLGFEQYHYFEDRYRTYAPASGITRDAQFLPTIIADYEKAKSGGKPVFCFNVSYQNHGPYETTAQYEKPYLAWENGYSVADYNIANNYLAGVAETGKQLSAFVDHFRAEKRPVVIVLFGDHNPWWGDDNAAYQMFGVDLDRSTVKGYLNYYSTPYLIWANDAAKAALGNDFQGDEQALSPAFLMQKLFTLAGWEGPAYLKALQALGEHTWIINRQQMLVQGEPVSTEDAGAPQWLTDFREVEYYQKHRPVTVPEQANATAEPDGGA